MPPVSPHSIPSPLNYANAPERWWSRETLHGSDDHSRPHPLEELDAYRSLATGLTREAMGCCNNNRYDLVAELQALLEWTEDFCQAEPLASAYDHSLCTFALLSAYGALARLQYEEVYEQVELVRSLVKEGELRRAREGQPADADREMQLRVLSLLAESKWLDGVPARDRILTPKQILGEYRRVAGRVQDYLSALEFPETELPDVLQDHGWSSLSILKVALRYLPDEQWSDVLDEFCLAHEISLLAEAEQHSPEPEEQSHKRLWWLEWEIAKLASRGPLATPELATLNARRLAVAQELNYGVGYLENCEREFDAISKKNWRQSLWSLAN